MFIGFMNFYNQAPVRGLEPTKESTTIQSIQDWSQQRIFYLKIYIATKYNPIKIIIIAEAF